MISYFIKKTRAILILLLLFVLFPGYIQADPGTKDETIIKDEFGIKADNSIIFRPVIGYGQCSSSDSKYEGNIFHYGGYILFKVEGDKRYGFEFSNLELKDGDDFNSIGIVLEQMLWGWLNLSIGTVGYFSYGEDSDSPVGLLSGISWEPQDFGNFKPFISYRNDIIFHDDTAYIDSLSIGFNWEF